MGLLIPMTQNELININFKNYHLSYNLCLEAKLSSPSDTNFIFILLHFDI